MLMHVTDRRRVHGSLRRQRIWVERWRKACREALEEADGLGFVKRVIAGEPEQMVGVEEALTVPRP